MDSWRRHAGTIGKAPAGRDPYGYRTDAGPVVVDPDRAAVIRRIFEEYVQPGASLRSVADRLNRDGIKTRTGNTWKQTSDPAGSQKPEVHRCVRPVQVHGPASTMRISGGEIVARTKADKPVEAEPLVVEGNHEPIVGRELFERGSTQAGTSTKADGTPGRLPVHFRRVGPLRRLPASHAGTAGTTPERQRRKRGTSTVRRTTPAARRLVLQQRGRGAAPGLRPPQVGGAVFRRGGDRANEENGSSRLRQAERSRSRRSISGSYGNGSRHSTSRSTREPSGSLRHRRRSSRSCTPSSTSCGKSGTSYSGS